MDNYEYGYEPEYKLEYEPKYEPQPQMQTEKKTEPTKKKTGFFKRFAALVASAAIFGGVAGGVFNLVAGKQIARLKEVQEITDTAQEPSGAENFFGQIEGELTEEPSGVDVAPALPVASVKTENTGMDVSEIVENVMPSIVAINVQGVYEMQDFFGYTQRYESEGSGSGIIVGENDKELLIVTNNHVVEDAETVNVTFYDEEKYEAKVKGTDSDNDLAIIVVDLKDIKASTMEKIRIASLGNSDDIKVGEQVVAIGNALGYGQSVTTGIVSAKDRMNSTNTTPLIQTDAAINPGNSGGALLNMKGEVIGINSSKFMSTEVEGMGYAIPVTAVESQLDELMNRKTREKVPEEKKGYIGVYCQTVDAQTSELYGIPVGALVAEVYKGSAADKAGIKKNYVITKLDGQTVSGASDLIDKLNYYAAGERTTITYKYLQDDEYKEKTVEIVLGRRPKTD